MKKPREARLPSVRTIAEPAKVMAGHVQDTKSAVRGRYRQCSSDPLRQYADSGQINEAQFEAGRWYEERFRTVFEKSGRDSTDVGMKVGSSGSTTPLSQYQAVCLRELIAVDSRLAFENRVILRGICGEGRAASECVREITGESSPHFPIPRFRESLTKLGEAIHRARQEKWTVSLSRVQ